MEVIVNGFMWELAFFHHRKPSRNVKLAPPNERKKITLTTHRFYEARKFRKFCQYNAPKPLAPDGFQPQF